MKRIAVAGSILVDKLNEIDAYPKEGELTAIRHISYAVGGCVPNVAIDLKTLDGGLDVTAVGRIGDDDYGRLVEGELYRRGVRSALIKGGKTSFTEVMSVRGGQRTFFCYTGANAQFGYDDIDFDALGCDMLHLGYFLLLDKVDGGDGERILREATRRGITTSIDFVSENSDRFRDILPCLRYTDNLIINEVEAGKLAGTEPADGNIKAIAQKLLLLGVRKRVIIHKSEFSVCCSAGGCTVLPSFVLPDGYIHGSTGAGDAFCAGCLTGIAEGQSDLDILTTGTLAATAALSAFDAVSGLKDISTLKQLYKDFKRREICS